MANHTQFFSDGTTVYGASDFIAPMNALTTSGIIGGYQVTAPSSGMTVNVAAGSAILNGVLTTDDTTQAVPVPTNTGGNARTDAIVLQIDATAMTTTVVDVPGATTEAANQILLAVVTVPAGASSIVAGNIDGSGRVYAGLDNPFAAVASASLGSNGYVLLGNGLALQWGTLSLGAFPAYTDVSFPQAFSAVPFTIVATMEDSAPYAVSTAVWTATKFTAIQADSVAHLMHWFAVGPMAVVRT
ncbi:gp53-like domain-containing protein [Ethanoligenens harbinense]|uniref:Putative tail fiber protein gp53-like C-terminal domain-containing protein n=1 Tax=Ethanoligenens harbinense (strain DSM 18485 / JCM 12961 / CGMCC 1.5033 / YUAN-3) TaxID=663278 RepID=E6U618_ETHHY|nr:hypothetical protein [Ethanoligenens harbinense]ADU25697.1 hypothetical protein Ethha_0107 [Ethanoligenens harbinense YUAN-3]AVQ94872.1 hypothetical protein CXQ68_00545 [Ethanoligenens harbinense YUAN-3]AYF37563.1 hypothetical protein CXP51_00550 [Ethanoligenens harbinense]QCN91118.1 hypothetical protein DRA42_00555 [Ethanoligenens harbinense]